MSNSHEIPEIKAINALLDGTLIPAENGLWKLIDTDGRKTCFTEEQKTHIKFWTRDKLVPAENESWEINYDEKSELQLTDKGFKISCYSDNVGGTDISGIELLSTADGGWKVNSYDNNYYYTNEEIEAQEKEYRNSKEYYKRLLESSRYDGGDRLSDGYSSGDDDEDNIMRGLESGNGDLMGF